MGVGLSGWSSWLKISHDLSTIYRCFDVSWKSENVIQNWIPCFEQRIHLDQHSQLKSTESLKINWLSLTFLNQESISLKHLFNHYCMGVKWYPQQSGKCLTFARPDIHFFRFFWVGTLGGIWQKLGGFYATRMMLIIKILVINGWGSSHKWDSDSSSTKNGEFPRKVCSFWKYGLLFMDPIFTVLFHTFCPCFWHGCLWSAIGFRGLAAKGHDKGCRTTRPLGRGRSVHPHEFPLTSIGSQSKSQVDC